MASSEYGNTARKPSRGRQKVEIKKVEHKSKRYVTFSKRKQGLFNKAAELSILSKAEIALIIFSQNDKLFTFGSPNPDAVIRRYLSGWASASSFKEPAPQELRSEAALKQQYELALNKLEEEKKRLETIGERCGASNGSGLWWNQAMEDMDLEDLEMFKASIEELKQNLLVSLATVEEMMRLKSLPAPPLLPPSLPPNFSYMSQLNGYVPENQSWDNWNGSGAQFPHGS